MKDVKEFFLDSGITQVTIQPEFHTNNGSTKELPNCLMQCLNEDCRTSHCCPNLDNKAKKGAIVKPLSKEKLPGDEDLNLKSIKMLENDLRSSTASIQTVSSSSSLSGAESISSSVEIVQMEEEIKTDQVSTINSEQVSVESK